MMSDTAAREPKSDWLLRPMHWQDVPAAVDIDAVAFPYDPWSAETFWSELARAPRHALYLAAQRQGAMDGYAGMAYIDSDAHLQTLAVRGNAARCGLGRALLAAVLDDAKGRGAKRCLLEVKPDNGPAIELYQSTGFVGLGTRPGYYPGGDAALVLELDLADAS